MLAKKKKDNTKDKILDTARKRFLKLSTEQAENRKRAVENKNFVYNIDDAQWTKDEKDKRISQKRPYLTHNKLRKFVAQVANRERDQRISQKVIPVDDKADPFIADTIGGYIHSIEYQSDADIIYAKAGEQALSGGFGGFMRILTKFTEDSFDQEIFIEHIENEFCVYLDPKENYGFIREAMTKEDFESQFPDKDFRDFGETGEGEEYELWYEDEKIFVAEYFYKEKVESTIAQIISEDDIDGQPETVELTEEHTPELLMSNGYKILKTRKVKKDAVRWCKITGNDILEGFEDGKVRDWAGNDIPIIEVEGDKVNIAGKTYKRALIEDAKDPCRLYNFSITAIAERASLVPKAPYIVTAEMIKNYEPMWKASNEENLSHLIVNQTIMGFPHRQDPPLVDQGLIMMTNLGDKDIQDTVGMFDSSFGERSNERTGKAINARTARSDMGIYHFPDNLHRAIKKLEKQLIYLIPKIIDTNRMLRIRDYEGKEVITEVNKSILDPNTGKTVIINDLSVGKYDLESGLKTWSTRREEATEGFLESMQYAPAIAPILAKHYFKNADFPDAGEIAEEIDAFLQSQQQTKTNQGGM
ncbi:MAG: portal protein [Gallionella sp.]|jgi:hypothetical protein